MYSLGLPQKKTWGPDADPMMTWNYSKILDETWWKQCDTYDQFTIAPAQFTYKLKQGCQNSRYEVDIELLALCKEYVSLTYLDLPRWFWSSMVKLGLSLPSANTGGAGVAAEARLSRPLGGPKLPTTHRETNVKLLDAWNPTGYLNPRMSEILFETLKSKH